VPNPEENEAAPRSSDDRPDEGTGEQESARLLAHATESIFCFVYVPPIPNSLPVEEQIRRLQQGTLADCNQVYARFNGARTRGEIKGKTLAELFRLPAEIFEECLRKFIDNGYTMSGAELRETLPDGDDRYRLCNARGEIRDGGLVRLWGSSRDITEQCLAERALRNSERNYREIFNAVNDAIVIHPIDSAIVLDANDRICQLTGYPLEELRGAHVTEISPPLPEYSRAEAEEWMRRTREEGSQLFEWRFRAKDGHEFPIEVNLKRVNIGDQPRIVAVLRDISERKRFDEELTKTQGLLMAAVEQTPSGIILADAPDGRIRVANTAALEMRGESAAFLTDVPLALHPERWQTYRPDGTTFPAEELPLAQAILQGRVLRNVDVIVRRHGGEDRWILANAAPVRDTAGRVAAGVMVFTDVTDLKRAEEALRREQERARLYLDVAEVVLVALDAEARITLINRRGCALLGYHESELIGRNWFDVCLPEEVRDETKEVYGRLMEGELQPLEHYENPVVTRRGERRLVAWHNALIRGEDGRIKGTLSSGEDITDRRRMQEAIIQSEKMMTVGGLAAGMAHEINNPLSGILQGVQNILRRTAPDSAANQEAAARCGCDLAAMERYMESREVLAFLSGIQESAMRAARIVTNMLQFSRPASATPQFTDLNALLDRVLDLAAADFDLKKRYDFRAIRIVRQYDRRLVDVPCISTELEQVVMNLVKNAAQAMAESTVEGEPPRLTVRTLRTDDWACIEIEDNGPGMNEETRRRAFEPFFTTKDVGSGTGLGLSVSYFIVTNNHRGTIDLDSHPGRGARFTIRLPLEGRPAHEPFTQDSARR